LPGLLFGGLSIGSGLLTFFLPETLNRPLPQTIEDIENWSKKPPGRADKSEPAAEHEMSAVQGKDSVGGNAAPANAI